VFENVLGRNFVCRVDEFGNYFASSGESGCTWNDECEA